MYYWSLYFRTLAEQDKALANFYAAQVFVNATNQIAIEGAENSNYAIYNAMGQLIENGILKSKLQTSNFKLQTGFFIVKVNNQSTRLIIK